jgi:ATP-dependent DNA helicase RecG
MAKRRLAFEEFFLTHLAALIRRSQWMNKKVVHQLLLLPYRGMVNAFIKNLPFELTDAQKIALREILSDLTGAKPMNRLLEGEVGSGKTVVATIAMYVVFLNGFQSVLMAPTEILANQHYKTISELLANYGVRVELITGATRSKRKDKKIEDADILVGTHALINRSLRFDKIGLVVIDEQQRFGVEQRALLREKAVNPHVLTMTATPIPRTVFLTLYGDLDLSYLNELPKERKLVKTWLVPQEKREAGYEWIKKQIKENGDQVFIICPFIEESETLTSVKAAKKEFERLKADIFPEFRVGLLHGRLKAKEKNEVIEKFKNREIDILVSTPVVEVGIDIPNATIILIEAAERFGLAQLHQLRGRVGRGNKQSYCLLFTESKSEQTLKRLAVMEKIFIGAELAELDLKLRGPGELYGTLQHGIPKLKAASFSDFDLIQTTKGEAEKILPHIDQFPRLLEKLNRITAKEISPD